MIKYVFTLSCIGMLVFACISYISNDIRIIGYSLNLIACIISRIVGQNENLQLG